MTFLIRPLKKLRKNGSKGFHYVAFEFFGKVSRKVSTQTIDASIISKIDGLYLKKRLSGKFHKKHIFYTFKMVQSKNIEQNLDDFKKVTSDLIFIDHKVKDETQAIILIKFSTLKV